MRGLGSIGQLGSRCPHHGPGQKQSGPAEDPGKKPDGTNDPEQENLLDVKNYIDYMMLNFYSGNTDWPGKNFYVARQRGAESEGFKFYSWDAERSLNDQEGAHVNVDMTNVSEGVGALYSSLRFNDDSVLCSPTKLTGIFSTVAYFTLTRKTRSGSGHPERNLPAARYSEMADKSNCHWSRNPPAGVTPDARNGLHDGRMASDTRRHVHQLASPAVGDRVESIRATRPYPELAAPRLSQHGGTIDGNLPLTIDAPGEVYFTLNGTDPRRSSLEPGATQAGISPRAQRYEAGITIDQPIVVKARTYADGQWSA